MKGSATKRWKETEWHKDKVTRKKKWHKDKVTGKQNEERQSNKRDRVTAKTECIKKQNTIWNKKSKVIKWKNRL